MNLDSPDIDHKRLYCSLVDIHIIYDYKEHAGLPKETF